MNALGWALLHFLWQGAALAALLAGALRMANHASPETRYGLSTLTLGLMTIAVPATTLYLIAAASLPPTVAESSMNALQAASSSALERVLTAPGTKPVESLLPWLVVTWAVGAGLLLLRLLGGWLTARRSIRAGVACGRDFSMLAARVGLTRPVAILVSPLAVVPHVFGWVKPAVMLPASVLTGLTSDQLEAVIAHELAHIVRHDYVINLFQSIVESVLFYHPAVWWVSSTVRTERESCCDDIVVALTGDRITYSRALLALEETRMRLAPAATGSNLKARIARLLGQPRGRDVASAPGTILLVTAIALIGGVAWLSAGGSAALAPANTDAVMAAATDLLAPGSQATAAPRPPAPPAPPAPAPSGPTSAPPPAPPAPELPPPAPPVPASPPPPALPAPPAPPAPRHEPTKGDTDWPLTGADWEQLQQKIHDAVAKAQQEIGRIDAEELRKSMDSVREAMKSARTHLESPEFKDQMRRAMEAAAEGMRTARDAIDADTRVDNRPLSAAGMERARRTRTADQKWSVGDTPGSTTPRGRVHVRSGPPDEITHVGDVEVWRYKASGDRPAREYRFDKKGERVEP